MASSFEFYRLKLPTGGCIHQLLNERLAQDRPYNDLLEEVEGSGGGGGYGANFLMKLHFLAQEGLQFGSDNYFGDVEDREDCEFYRPSNFAPLLAFIDANSRIAHMRPYFERVQRDPSIFIRFRA